MVVRGIISNLFMGFFVLVRITSFSTVDGWINLYLSQFGEGASQGCALALRERVVVVWGIISILCKVFLVEGVFPRSLRWVDA